MYKLGAGMFAASIILLIGWVLYKLWQSGNIDGIIGYLIFVFFVIGLVLVFASEKL